MEQSSASATGFREVAEGGNPGVQAEHEPYRPDPRWSINPFIALLWLLAAVLVVGSLAILSTVTFNIGPLGGPPTVLFLTMTFAPHALLVGVVVVLCLLFWHAWRWQQWRGDRPAR
ncbi:hypothetical protein [Arthrobacter sp. Soil763]|uniref:hypothetical protein n=1 Tax=Arthrobacter sp. Soil763 TaxID=1736402 RepID=UPI000701BE5E|nr:hypothetical protein [Arthrobacter sp. Soil763]KRE80090.1 hypothetical protein ASG71_08695 [Arthrobacter sp. Soil763]